MKVKYVGNGSFLVGIPARDLSASEVKKFGIVKLIDSGLYAEIKRKPKADQPEVEIIEEA